MTRAVALLATTFLLAACESAPGDAPSLLPRPAESQSFDEPAPVPTPSATPDAALELKIAALIDQRSKAVAEFAAADRRIANILAAGGRAAPGSDAWLDAQTAIGALDAGRADVLAVQTELEQLAIARAAEGQPPYPALERAMAGTQTELNRIDKVLAERKAALPL
jgi:hypothetical protein